MKTIIKSTLLILVIGLGVMLTVYFPITWIAAQHFFCAQILESNADNRPFGRYFKGRVYELNRDLIMNKDNKSGKLDLLYKYEDVNGEVFPMDCDIMYCLWKRVPQGTQFIIKEVKMTHSRLGDEHIIPDFYAEVEEPFEEGVKKLVNVSNMFSFDLPHLIKEENKSRNWDIVITECIKPKENLIKEVVVR